MAPVLPLCLSRSHLVLQVRLLQPATLPVLHRPPAPPSSANLQTLISLPVALSYLLCCIPSHSLIESIYFYQLSSVQSLRRVRLCNPMDCSKPRFLSCPSPTPRVYSKLTSIESVMPSNHLILCHPLLLPPSTFPSIRVFSDESVIRIRWTKDWSFNFNVSPSNEYSGLISFRMNWLDLLAVQGILRSLL